MKTNLKIDCRKVVEEFFIRDLFLFNPTPNH